MPSSIVDAKKAFFLAQIPGALPTMSISDLETIFFANPTQYIKNSSPTEDELGYKGWTYDPVIASANSPLTAGLLFLNLIQLRKPASISTIVASIQAAGVTLTAGQCFAGLWKQSDRTLVGLSADQSGNWISVGKKNMALVGGPFQLAAGGYYAGFWANGATPPAFTRHTNAGGQLTNGELASPLLRECNSADAALTNVAPSPFTLPQASQPSSPWAAIF